MKNSVPQATRMESRRCVARFATAAIAMAGLLTGSVAVAQPRDAGKQDREGLLARMTAFHTEVPGHPFDIVLVNPTPTSVTASIVAYADTEGYVEVVGSPRLDPGRTDTRLLKAGEPALFVMGNLRADTAYAYRFWSRLAATGAEVAKKAEFTPSKQYSFHTPRPAGSPFTFTIVADSHLDANMTPTMYEQTLANALADRPDFHIDLGDTFMTDKRGRDFKAALPQYIAQRYYFGKLCHSAPLFMVLGNHDGEWGYARGDADAMAPWSFAQRTKYFPPPGILDNADGKAMYSGCTTYAKGQGANYYAFTWGDAQFIVLDPFWYTNEKARGHGGRGGSGAAGGGKGGRGGDGGNGGKPAEDADTTLTDQGWTMTLGQPQYDWLTRTLENSHSKFKFVFIHHLVGGLGRSSRGGIAAAPYFEWGGKNADGADGFAAHRPGWAMPIHQVLAKHHVSAVFHGHDHLYVHEELDGIAYQCVPQPGNVGGGTRSATEYGYRVGTILSSPGHVRVKVSSEAAKVEFVRPVTPPMPKDGKPDRDANRTMADSYDLRVPHAASK